MNGVAVVGAGIAGIACARALAAAGVPVTVLDRGRVVGGRMASRTFEGRPVDSGASYFTARGEGFRSVVDDWTGRGLARVWTDSFPILRDGTLEPPKAGPDRYAAPRGLRSLIADLAAGLDVRQQREVGAVGPGPTVDGDPYDAVVLAMPDPQAYRLLDPALDAERSVLAGRAWEPALALLAGFPERSWPAFRGAFVDGDDTLTWIADDGDRRGDGAPVLVAHSTAGFAAARLTDPAAAAAPMVAALRRLLPVADEPSWTYVQRWTFARPAGPRDEPFHLGPALVGLAGCGWGSPRVETAWTSGDALGHDLATRLGQDAADLPRRA